MLGTTEASICRVCCGRALCFLITMGRKWSSVARCFSTTIAFLYIVATNGHQPQWLITPNAALRCSILIHVTFWRWWMWRSYDKRVMVYVFVIRCIHYRPMVSSEQTQYLSSCAAPVLDWDKGSLRHLTLNDANMMMAMIRIIMDIDPMAKQLRPTRPFWAMSPYFCCANPDTRPFF
jgi:hypothetical protein